MYFRKKFRFILLFIGFGFGFASIFGQDVEYESIADFHWYFGTLSDKLRSDYEVGIKIDDCDDEISHWMSMSDYMEDVDLIGQFSSAIYFFKSDIPSEDLLKSRSYIDDIGKWFELLEFFDSLGSGACDLTADAWRNIIKNYIMQVDIFHKFFESRDPIFTVQL